MLDLRDAIVSSLSADTVRRLEILAAWDLFATRKRLCKRMKWSDKRAKRIEYEYRKFFALIVLHPRRMYGMAGPVDELWHDHVLDSVDYARFCFEIAGKFIHHVPEDSAAGKRAVPAAAAYEYRTLPDLNAHFTSHHGNVWPQAGVKCGKQCNDARINPKIFNAAFFAVRL